VLQGLFFDMNNLAQGEWASILGCDDRLVHRPEISILDITKRNEILFVDLPTEGKSVQSGRFGKLLLQELMLVSGMRKMFPTLRPEKAFSVFIDEFDAFATESFVTFLNKGRSSRFMIHLIHQTLSDLKRVSPSFEGQILGNCNLRFIFRQDDPDDAEKWARVVGTKEIIKKTWQTDGSMTTGRESNREAEEFIISPNVIRNLKTGECVVINKTAGRSELVNIPYIKTREAVPRPIVRPVFTKLEKPKASPNGLRPNLDAVITELGVKVIPHEPVRRGRQ